MSENLILYGPPGTGKTYELQQKMRNFVSYELEDAYIVRTVEDYSKNSILLGMVILKAGTPQTTAEIGKTIANLKDFNTDNLVIQEVLEAHSLNNDLTKNNEKFFIEKGDKWYVDEKKFFSCYPELRDSFAQNEISKKRYCFVTFHQSYSYEDFVEGIRPSYDSQTKQLDYSPQNGIFKQICKKAKEDPDNDYAIFIDEINRGNISEIFGELITLIELDKRTGAKNAMEVLLPYSKEPFSVPSNLSIYGSMNSADKSITAFDQALRRRFSFQYFPPDSEILRKVLLSRKLDPENINGFNLIKFFNELNDRLILLLDKDHTVGHSYFMNVSNENDIVEIMRKKVLPTLEEYFLGEIEKIQMLFDDIQEKGQQYDDSIYIFKEIKPTDLMSQLSDGELSPVREYRINPKLTIDSFKRIISNEHTLA